MFDQKESAVCGSAVWKGGDCLRGVEEGERGRVDYGVR